MFSTAVKEMSKREAISLFLNLQNDLIKPAGNVLEVCQQQFEFVFKFFVKIEVLGSMSKS